MSAGTVYYSEIQTELLGDIWLAATDTGICCLRFADETPDFVAHILENIADPLTPSLLHSREATAAYIEALTAYLENKTPIPNDLPSDLSRLTEFQQEILAYVRELPYATITTYGEIADEIQNPNASRAIGQVLRRNPIPIIIPCHRVTSADGTLGGYGGVMGSERKIALLKHEGVILA